MLAFMLGKALAAAPTMGEALVGHAMTSAFTRFRTEAMLAFEPSFALAALTMKLMHGPLTLSVLAQSQLARSAWAATVGRSVVEAALIEVLIAARCPSVRAKAEVPTSIAPAAMREVRSLSFICWLWLFSLFTR